MLQSRILMLAAALVLVTGLLSTTFRATTTVTAIGDVRSEVSDRIDAFVIERMQAHGIPGAAVAVVRAGEVVHLAGYGTADPDGRPVTADTPFLIASVAKPFTATAVLGLVEEGVLSLDEPVLPYVKDLTDEIPAGFEDVTVEHLLSHTSGLGFVAGTAGVETIHQGDDALERRAADILARPLSAAPGEQFAYSNGGYSVLGAVVERATGSTYDDYMREHVFEPLGMTNSFASDRDPRADRLATGHSQWFGRWRPRDLPYDRAGAPMGYIASSAEDLTRFMQAHLGAAHQDVVSPRLRTLSQRPATGDTGFDDPAQAGYGMGWFVGDTAGRPSISHSGELGHFTTHLNLLPEEDRLGVAVLTNASAVVAGQGGNYNLSADLTRLLLGEDVAPAHDKHLMTVVIPLAVWGAAGLLLLAAGRYLLLALPRLRVAGSTSSGGRRWLRHVILPALGYMLLAAALLPPIPLGLARHMAPDIGWGVTVIAYLALIWVVLRTALAINAMRPRGQVAGPSDGARS